MVPPARSITWRRRMCGCGPARTRPRSSPPPRPLASRYPGIRANGGLVFVDNCPAQVDRHRAGASGRSESRSRCSPRWPGSSRWRCIGQLLARQMSLDAAGYGVLSALGMTRGGLLALAGRPARAGHRGRRGHRHRHRDRGVAADADRGRAASRAGSRESISTPWSSASALPPWSWYRSWCSRRRPSVRCARRAAPPPRQHRQPPGPSRDRPGWRARSPRAGTVTGGIGTRMAFEPGHGRPRCRCAARWPAPRSRSPQ